MFTFWFGWTWDSGLGHASHLKLLSDVVTRTRTRIRIRIRKDMEDGLDKFFRADLESHIGYVFRIF
jgi:hypothetical protein